MDIAAFLSGQVLAYEDHRKVQTLSKGLWSCAARRKRARHGGIVIEGTLYDFREVVSGPDNDDASREADCCPGRDVYLQCNEY